MSESIRNDKTLFRKFYSIIDSALNIFPEKEIEVLQSFLTMHPNFERSFLKVLERYLIRHQKSKAHSYFKGMFSVQHTRQLSAWMLAKIAVLNDQPDSALHYFSHAYRPGPVSHALNKCFADFLFLYHKQLNIPAILDKFQFNNTPKNAIIAFFNYRLGLYDSALRSFDRFISEQVTDPVLTYYLGDTYYRMGKINKADSLWREGLLQTKAVNDLEYLAHFMINRGVAAKYHGNLAQALSYYDSAYVIAKKIDDFFLQQRVEGNSANIFKIQGNYQKASQFYEKAVMHCRAVGASNYLAVWFSNYAGTLRLTGLFDEAIGAYDSSEVYASRANMQDYLIEIKIEKAYFYFYLNQNDFAKRIYQDAYDIAVKQELEEYRLRAKAKLADLWVSEENLDSAKHAYRNYISFLKNDPRRQLEVSYWISQLAQTYRAESDLEWAKKLFRKAKNIAVKVHSESYEAWYLLEIARIELTNGDHGAAKEKFEKVLQYAQKGNENLLLAQTWNGLGQVYMQSGNFHKAISAFRLSAAEIELSRSRISVEDLRIGYFSDRNKVYKQLARCFLELYLVNQSPRYIDSVFYFSEMSRARAIQDWKFTRDSGNFHDKSDSLYRKYQNSAGWLRSIQRKLREISCMANYPSPSDKLISNLKIARHSLISNRLRMQDEIEIVSLEDRQAIPELKKITSNLLAPDLAMLFYQIFEDASFVIVANSDEVKIIKLDINIDTLAHKVDKLMNPFHHVRETHVHETVFRADIAYELYRLLIEPIEQAIILPERILVIPDLVLMNLPFDILLAESPRQPSYTPLEFPDYAENFIVNKYAFIYSPTTSIIKKNSRTLFKSSQMLIVANPYDCDAMLSGEFAGLRAGMGWRFDPLISADIEADEIKKINPKAKIYHRQDAKKNLILKEINKFPVVHFAAHGFVDLNFDAFSGIVLAASEDVEDDGLLMGYEISELNLDCELVTLSACETGRGKLVSGEGVMGLPRLFIGAGVNSVLMTFWKVDDRFTSKLMPKFYDLIFNKKMTKTRALQQAKRFHLTQVQPDQMFYTQHPFYWAAFTLYGNPQNIDKSVFSKNLFIKVSLLAIGIGLVLFYLRFKLFK